MLDCAKRHGLAIKLHTGVPNRIGGFQLALKMGALSVDHLRPASQNSLRCCLLQARQSLRFCPEYRCIRIPPALEGNFIDAGFAVAVGTDLNPGSDLYIPHRPLSHLQFG